MGVERVRKCDMGSSTLNSGPKRGPVHKGAILSVGPKTGP